MVIQTLNVTVKYDTDRDLAQVPAFSFYPMYTRDLHLKITVCKQQDNKELKLQTINTNTESRKLSYFQGICMFHVSLGC